MSLYLQHTLITAARPCHPTGSWRPSIPVAATAVVEAAPRSASGAAVTGRQDGTTLNVALFGIWSVSAGQHAAAGAGFFAGHLAAFAVPRRLAPARGPSQVG
jgi:hypothetical protein